MEHDLFWKAVYYSLQKQSRRPNSFYYFIMKPTWAQRCLWYTRHDKYKLYLFISWNCTYSNKLDTRMFISGRDQTNLVICFNFMINYLHLHSYITYIFSSQARSLGSATQIKVLLLHHCRSWIYRTTLKAWPASQL